MLDGADKEPFYQRRRFYWTVLLKKVGVLTFGVTLDPLSAPCTHPVQQGWIKPPKNTFYLTSHQPKTFADSLLCVIRHIKNKHESMATFALYLHMLFCTAVACHLCLGGGPITTGRVQPWILHSVSPRVDGHALPDLLLCFIFLYHTYYCQYLCITCCLH